MPNPIVFFSRCKPQGVDAIEIALEYQRVFIGHPMAREGAVYNPHNLRTCVVDPSCPDQEWGPAHAASDGRPQFNQNRNLIRQIRRGSIAMIPRPSSGVIFCGKIVSEFELTDDPPWYDRYMEIRGDADGPNTFHSADVAQGWGVDRFQPIPTPRIPVWIRRSLFGRSTYGVIHPDQVAGDPYPVICRIMEGDNHEIRAWTLDTKEIENRMISDLTPSSFEHLAVSLFQLENPNEVWSHVGGSGDGGVDGLGADQNGSVIGLLQCKWQYWGEGVFPEGTVWDNENQPPRKYLAALRYPEGTSPQGCEFMGRKKIAELVRKHYKTLPQSMSMRIGPTPTTSD